MLTEFYNNDRVVAVVRNGWQAVISAAVNYLAVHVGFDVEEASVMLLTWPLVHVAYTALAYWVTSKVEALSLPLTGPGVAPSYRPQTYDEAIKMATGK